MTSKLATDRSDESHPSTVKLNWLLQYQRKKVKRFLPNLSFKNTGRVIDDALSREWLKRANKKRVHWPKKFFEKSRSWIPFRFWFQYFINRFIPLQDPRKHIFLLLYFSFSKDQPPRSFRSESPSKQKRKRRHGTIPIIRASRHGHRWWSNRNIGD